MYSIDFVLLLLIEDYKCSISILVRCYLINLDLLVYVCIFPLSVHHPTDTHFCSPYIPYSSIKLHCSLPYGLPTVRLLGLTPYFPPCNHCTTSLYHCTARVAHHTPSLSMFAQQTKREPIKPVVLVISETLLTTTSATALLLYCLLHLLLLSTSIYDLYAKFYHPHTFYGGCKICT